MKTCFFIFTLAIFGFFPGFSQSFKISGAFVIAPGDSVIHPEINRGKEMWSGTGSMIFVPKLSYLVSSINTYKRGELDGYSMVFYPNGMPKWYEQWECGNLHGKIIYWNENGEIKKIEYYNNGIYIKTDSIK